MGHAETRRAIPPADELPGADGVADAPAHEPTPANGLCGDGIALISVKGDERRSPRWEEPGGKAEMQVAIGVVAVYNIGRGEMRPGGAPG
jgi:hypothetical protein